QIAHEQDVRAPPCAWEITPQTAHDGCWIREPVTAWDGCIVIQPHLSRRRGRNINEPYSAIMTLRSQETEAALHAAEQTASSGVISVLAQHLKTPGNEVCKAPGVWCYIHCFRARK